MKLKTKGGIIVTEEKTFFPDEIYDEKDLPPEVDINDFVKIIDEGGDEAHVDEVDEDIDEDVDEDVDEELPDGGDEEFSEDIDEDKGK